MSKLPTPAERLRSLLAAAGSLTLHVPGRRCDLVGAHRVEAGRILLQAPDSVLLEPDCAAVLELTDVVPTPVRSRVRARATFGGWLTAVGGAPGPGRSGRGLIEPDGMELALELVEATLQDPAYGRDREISVDPDAFAAAVPDPLAEAEADLLCHLVAEHPDAVERLSRLIPPHHLHGVRRILPVRLDRYGVVLRLEFAGRARDVRLPFLAPLHRAEEAGDKMQELYARARCCHGGH
ncbi:DUF2470 domain-containing protein [Dactylosporangium sp. NPDC051485]|uniref:DUF2470 domain-containing protein n=1 Tax=Dactylosporangium sp. NPDC051485 TaxID=3154846 RepID=UPI00343A8BE5